VKLFMVMPHQLLFAPGFGQHRQTFVVKQIHGVAAAQGQIKSAGGGGDLLQQGLVELGLDHLALFVADVIAAAIRMGDRHQGSLRGTDADGENFQPLARGVLRRFERALVIILAVRQQDHGFIVIVFLESGQGGVDGGGESRAALRNGIHVQRLDALQEGRVINRQRAFQKGVAGEGHQPEAIRPRPLHQLQRGQLRPGEPVGRNIRREHGFGSVHGHDDVQSPLLDLLEVIAILRAGDGHHQQGRRQDDQPIADFPSPRRYPHGQ